MIKVENLTKEITKELQRYSRMVKEEVEEAKKATSKQVSETIKANSPILTGDYKKGWRIKKLSKNDSYIVHNKTDYQLTHLLEHGHAKRNGGRTKARPHIRPAEEEAIKNYLRLIDKAVKG